MYMYVVSWRGMAGSLCEVRNHICSGGGGKGSPVGVDGPDPHLCCLVLLEVDHSVSIVFNILREAILAFEVRATAVR